MDDRLRGVAVELVLLGRASGSSSNPCAHLIRRRDPPSPDCVVSVVMVEPFEVTRASGLSMPASPLDCRRRIALFGGDDGVRVAVCRESSSYCLKVMPTGFVEPFSLRVDPRDEKELCAESFAGIDWNVLLRFGGDVGRLDKSSFEGVLEGGAVALLMGLPPGALPFGGDSAPP